MFMIKTELVAILSTISPEDRRRMCLFLESPYFTDGKDTGKEKLLIEHIIGALSAQETSGPALEAEYIYKLLYPGRSFTPATMNNLIVQALAKVRQFIDAEMALRGLRPMASRRLHLDFFLDKGDLDLCDKYLKRLERETERKNSWDDLDFLLAWQAEDAKANYLGMLASATRDFNLKENLQALDDFYLIQRLNTLTTLFNLNSITPILSTEERKAYIQSIDACCESPIFRAPLVELSRMVLLFFHEEDEQAEVIFLHFMELLSEYERDLSPFHVRRMESFAYNFCVRRYHIDRYKNIFLSLFQRQIQPERLAQNHSILANEVLSWVKSALVMQQFDWVKTFLEAHRHRVRGSASSEDYYQFNMALYHFEKGEFEKVRPILTRPMFHEMNYKILFKTLEIKIFYEEGPESYDLLESKLQNLKVSLSRETKMTSDKAVRYRRFVNFVLQMHNLRQKDSTDQRRLSKILKAVRSDESVAEGNWIIRKLNALAATPKKPPSAP